MNPIVRTMYFIGGFLIALFFIILGSVAAKKYWIAIIIILFLIGIIIFIFIKFKINFKSKEQLLYELRQRNMEIKEEYDANIDIDDIKSNPKLRDEIIKRGYPPTNRPLTYDLNSKKIRQNPDIIQKSKNHNISVCPHCKHKLQGHYKFCPKCGERM
jgi:hypothetical protein